MIWKSKNDQSIVSGDNSVNIQAIGDINIFDTNFPTELIDEKINEDLKNIRQSRFFNEYDLINSIMIFGKRIAEGDLFRCTDAVKRMSLAWCSRLLSRTDELSKAEDYLDKAKSLGSCPEIKFAEAFILSQKGDKETALSILAEIDSQASRTAALMIVTHHDGAEEAINWFKKAVADVTKLDAEGKYFFLAQQLSIHNWDEAKTSLNDLNDRDFEVVPVLHHMTAITHLITVVPIEFRSIILKQLPFEAANFPLADDTASMKLRDKAHYHFKEAVFAAKRLSLDNTAKFNDEYALWLELMDPQKASLGKKRLEELLRDTKSALRLVPLGLQFGVRLDIGAVEQEIDRQMALSGISTPDTMIARFALAFVQKKPEKVANYIAEHYDELSSYFAPNSLKSLQIDLLSRAGLPEKANELLNSLLEEDISEPEKDRLKTLVSEAEGTDTVETRKAQFEKTDSLVDLVALNDELENKKEWNSLCKYGALQFKRTHTIRDAKRLVFALSNSHKSEQLIEFFNENLELLSQSQNVQLAYAWALYYEGNFLQAQTMIEKLDGSRDNPNFRSLEISLCISIGDWNSLLTIVTNEYNEKENRTAHELIEVAQLAQNVGSPLAKELIKEVAGKANENASILSAAYFLASKGGWADDEKVFQWLNKAAELSGDDGPIQKVTLQEILDRKPDWDQRESKTWKLLFSGEIPMFLAAESLNKCLVDFMLLPAFANKSEKDPRRRSGIPSYSGKHPPILLNLSRTKIGIDATTLYTLGYLNLIEIGLDAFDQIVIPHSTLAWLFKEKQQAAFHQPSKFKDAHKLRDMIARETINKLISSAITDSDLSAQVGEELAQLIAEANKVRDNDDRQRLVIRSSPVHRVSSLLEEEADLESYDAIMSSCLSVVEKVREKGQITLEEETRARSYFQLHEKPWPNQPKIKDKAILYLDGLSTTYFIHLGILEKINAAGFTVVVSPRTISETNNLISYENVSGKVKDTIERIRLAVQSRIQSEKISVWKKRLVDESEDLYISEHPTVDIIALSGVCDAVFSDDRFFNQHSHINDGKNQAPVFTSFDLLGALASNDLISIEKSFEYKTLLRRAGYFFVPVTEDELTLHLKASMVKNDRVIETAELKAIRESILRVRMSDWLQLPKEAFWLDSTIKVFIKVLKNLWEDEADLTKVKVRSDWLIDQVDIRGWVHRFGKEMGDNIVKKGRGAFIHMTISPPLEANLEIQKIYSEWIEEKILIATKTQFPELYASMVEQQKVWITELTRNEPNE